VKGGKPDVGLSRYQAAFFSHFELQLIVLIPQRFHARIKSQLRLSPGGLSFEVGAACAAVAMKSTFVASIGIAAGRPTGRQKQQNPPVKRQMAGRALKPGYGLN